MYGQMAYNQLDRPKPSEAFQSTEVSHMLTTSTPSLSRSARLEARISLDQKAMLQRAAELSGRSVSEFVIASAQEAAAKLIQAHETIQLSNSEQMAFVAALLNPPEPGPRLRQAAQRYRERSER